jgi:hypothetical protein
MHTRRCVRKLQQRCIQCKLACVRQARQSKAKAKLCTLRRIVWSALHDTIVDDVLIRSSRSLILQTVFFLSVFFSYNKLINSIFNYNFLNQWTDNANEHRRSGFSAVWNARKHKHATRLACLTCISLYFCMHVSTKSSPSIQISKVFLST